MWRPAAAASAVAPLLLAVATATAIGCGGGGGDPADFADTANAICRERIDRIDELERGNTSPPEIEAGVAQAYERELGQLRELEPPTERASDFRRLLVLYERGAETQRAAADRLAQAERASGGATYRDLYERFGKAIRASRRHRARGNVLARELGLDTCGTVLY